MNILAIDPGYERLGFAILDKNKKEKESLIFSDCFKTSAKNEHAVRLAGIQEKISAIIDEYSPQELAIESLFFNTNQKTAMLVSEARGTVVATAQNAGLKVFEYTPQEIKMAVCGNGRGDKDAVIKMVPLLVNLPPKKRLDDEYDAIACGLAHLAINKA